MILRASASALAADAEAQTRGCCMENTFFELKHICKEYPGVRALDDVSVAFQYGEVHALLGENGAGKSTLIKVLAGAIAPTAGQILVDGTSYDRITPALAAQLGIGVIYQEFTLIPAIPVYENIFLGNEIRKARFLVDKKRMIAKTEELFRQLNIHISPEALVRELSVAEQQLVEIAKAVSRDVRILIMDEPSAPLTEREIGAMFDLVRTLKKKNVTVVYISHRLEELFEISDRVSILRDGRYIRTVQTAQTNEDELINLMIGRELESRYPVRAGAPSDEVVLEVRHLALAEKVKDVSFTLHKGEILGVSGLVGAGRTETVRAIFGAERIVSGEILIGGIETKIPSPRAAIAHGMALLPEDRKQQGVLLKMGVRDNTTLVCLDTIARGGVIQSAQEHRIVGQYIETLKIKTPNETQQVQYLSGGNQQKVVLAKWLASKAQIIIFDEPTRGIDVLAKHEIYELINQLADQGCAILMISSEMPELIGISDRVIVMYEGRVTGELQKNELTQARIMQLASGR